MKRGPFVVYIYILSLWVSKKEPEKERREYLSIILIHQCILWLIRFILIIFLLTFFLLYYYSCYHPLLSLPISHHYFNLLYFISLHPIQIFRWWVLDNTLIVISKVDIVDNWYFFGLYMLCVSRSIFTQKFIGLGSLSL